MRRALVIFGIVLAAALAPWQAMVAHANGPSSLPCAAIPANPLALSVDKAGEAELLAATNRERAAAGVPPLASRSRHRAHRRDPRPAHGARR